MAKTLENLSRVLIYSLYFWLMFGFRKEYLSEACVLGVFYSEIVEIKSILKDKDLIE